MNSKLDGKKALKIVFRILIILFVILLVAVVSLAGTFFYIRWKANVQESPSGDVGFLGQLLVPKKEVEPVVTCLFVGANQNLTDFIMLGQYDPNTREIDLISIPRDTNVGNASVDGKINSIYSSRSLEKLIEEVESITGVEVQHYVWFRADVLQKIVDEIGGVTVDVPINMNYDDPEQNLHIHLNKGVQTLNGSQAEQFVRFRKNNNGTGYAGGDVERTKAQQQFIKAFISELLKAKNISKISTLINIVIERTKTDVTFDVAKNYIDDVIAIRTDRINADTIPGEGRYGESPLGHTTSYYYIDKEAAEEMIQQMFFNKGQESAEVQEVYTTEVRTEPKTEKDTIRIELLNAGSTTAKVNALVEKLKKEGFYVAKIGNYETTKTETSRIVDYGTCTEEVIEKVKAISNLSNREEVSGQSSVDFTIIIGPRYE